MRYLTVNPERELFVLLALDERLPHLVAIFNKGELQLGTMYKEDVKETRALLQGRVTFYKMAALPSEIKVAKSSIETVVRLFPADTQAVLTASHVNPVNGRKQTVRIAGMEKIQKAWDTIKTYDLTLTLG